MNLAKTVILSLFLFSFSGLYAQETMEELITDAYIPALCQCLEENKDDGPKQLVTTTSIRCGLKFAMANMKSFQQTTEEKFPDLTKEEEYEVGRLLGGDIRQKAAGRLVKECANYKLALVAYREELASGTSKGDVKSEVKRLQKMIETGSDRSNAQTYLTIGALLVKAGDREGAMEAYINSNNLKATALAEGFKALLELN